MAAEKCYTDREWTGNPDGDPLNRKFYKYGRVAHFKNVFNGVVSSDSNALAYGVNVADLIYDGLPVTELTGWNVLESTINTEINRRNNGGNISNAGYISPNTSVISIIPIEIEAVADFNVLATGINTAVNDIVNATLRASGSNTLPAKVTDPANWSTYTVAPTTGGGTQRPAGYTGGTGINSGGGTAYTNLSQAAIPQPPAKYTAADITDVGMEAATNIVTASDFNKLVAAVNSAINQCICNANKCTCNCNYCQCNTDMCACNCNYCACDCNYCCVCNCNY